MEEVASPLIRIASERDDGDGEAKQASGEANIQLQTAKHDGAWHAAGIF